MWFLITKNLQSLQTTRKEMFSMRRNTTSEKHANLSKIYIFFHGRQRIAQKVEERKVDIFSIAIWIAIFYRPVANKKILRQEPSWTSTMEIFIFLQKSPIVNVRLGSKYTSQLFLNEGFLPPQHFSVQLFTKVFFKKNNHKPFF